ncbi:MAG: glycosyltransferase family 4 protein [Lachnospiraceae bacterium]|nr:glycosyltransferase family 4 protein [Lachnospiraceae bacterium]
MKILMLVNWKIEYCIAAPTEKQPPDYYVAGQIYWFFRYFKHRPHVDVLDIRSFKWWEWFEQYKLRFYIIQTLRALPKLKHYDLIISHGMQSGVVLSLLRRWFKTKAKHLVFEIGSFNSAAESGKALKFMQYASKSIDGLIYHTGAQKSYYQLKFPWLAEKSEFIPFGADFEFFNPARQEAKTQGSEISILCVGYAKRDWPTLFAAFSKLLECNPNPNIKLKLIGKNDSPANLIKNISNNIIFMPYIPIRQLISEIKAADFCVLPLEYFLYSYGQMTLLQQMALGKAVIAAHVPSLADYGYDNETLLFYQPGDSDDLAEKMMQLIKDENKRNQLGTAAAASIKKEFNEEKMAGQVEKFINELLGKSRKL